MDLPMEPTAENWPVIHHLYMSQAAARWKEGGGARRDSMLAESQVIAASLTPPMTPKEFRSWDAKMLGLLRRPSKPKGEEMTNGVGNPRAKRTKQFLGAFGVGDVELESTGHMQLARLALKGLKHKAQRFIVCESPEAAKEVQSRLHTAAKDMGWSNGSFESSTLPLDAIAAGGPVVILGVTRK